MFKKFMSFRVKKHAAKVRRRRYKRYYLNTAPPTFKQWKNYFKYMR